MLGTNISAEADPNPAFGICFEVLSFFQPKLVLPSIGTRLEVVTRVCVFQFTKLKSWLVSIYSTPDLHVENSASPKYSSSTVNFIFKFKNNVYNTKNTCLPVYMELLSITKNMFICCLSDQVVHIASHIYEIKST